MPTGRGDPDHLWAVADLDHSRRSPPFIAPARSARQLPPKFIVERSVGHPARAGAWSNGERDCPAPATLILSIGQIISKYFDGFHLGPQMIDQEI